MAHFPFNAEHGLRYRSMSEAELRGFRMALDNIRLWSAQIEASANRTPPSRETVPVGQHIRTSAKLMHSCAEMMETLLKT